MQMFIVTDFILGKPLDKKLLIKAKEEHRRKFYSQLIDILAELRKLEFPSIGSLMPAPDGSPQPVVGPILSMSAASLHLSPHPTLTSAKNYMKYQFSLVSGHFVEAFSDVTVDDIRQELFAIHGMERIFDQAIDPQLDKSPFILNHLDLRGANTIVDERYASSRHN